MFLSLAPFVIVIVCLKISLNGIIQIMENNIAHEVAQICINQFNSLPKTGKPKDNEWTILSCIVKEQNQQLEVVSLGTGSKCIGKTKMCPKGSVVNDSHAEVMCRRGFLVYLYGKLKIDSSIFNFDEPKKTFSLKPNIKFHFFTTHVPCGDAAIFPKELEEDSGDILQVASSKQDDNEVPFKKRKVDDIYRTGAKCLEADSRQDAKLSGSNYHVTGVVRTKPGRGDRTESVSCSDKLAKWCHLGIQGALLMLFLDKPIYLSSFIMLKGTPFCPNALDRALYKRLGNVDLIHPYTRGVLNIHLAEVDFKYGKRGDKVPCPSSIAWVCYDNSLISEVAVNGKKQGVTKKNYSTDKGQLKICKLQLFKLFVHKLNELSIKLDSGTTDAQKMTYRHVKTLSKLYQDNWCILQRHFGIWTNKERGLLDFRPT